MDYQAHRDRFNERVQRAHARGPDDEGAEILTILEVMMEAIDGLQAQFDDYKQTVTDAFGRVDTALGDFAGRVQELTTELQNAGVDPAKVQALADDITAAKTAAANEAAKIAAADPGAPAATDTGAAPAGTDAGAAAGGDAGATDTGAAAPDPSAAPAGGDAGATADPAGGLPT
jgi:hypothetical protein